MSRRLKPPQIHSTGASGKLPLRFTGRVEPADSGTLNIGLLLTYNEADVVAEMLEANSPHVDAIFALDGSSDATPEILQAHPKVRRVFRDAEAVGSGKVRDFHRQVLLEAARQEFGVGHWYTLLHGDEIFHHNPRKVIERAGREKASFVNWAAMQFFLHTSDEGRDLEAIALVQERLRWYSPFWLEVRQFKDRVGAAYQEGQHGRVVPQGIGWKPYSRVPVFKHYGYRSPTQMERKNQSFGSRTAHSKDSIFRQVYQPGYRYAYRFEGNFGRFEHPRYWWQMAWWRKHYIGI